MTKPSWYDDYKLALAKYVSENGTVEDPKDKYSNYPNYILSEESKHMRGCEISTVDSDPVEEISTFAYTNSYDSPASETDTSVSVQYTCKCGKVKKHYGEVQGNLSDVIQAVI